MKYKIIVDSSSDLNNDYLQNTNVDFAVVPFTVNVGQRAFVDHDGIDTNELLLELESFNGKPVSACPSPQAFIDLLTGADKYFIITISSKLSGCYNSAICAKNSYPTPNDVCVIDSKLAGTSSVLIVDKLLSMISQKMDYEQICKAINEYVNYNIDVLFTLKDFSNFVKNGRLTPMQALIASTLKITPICSGEQGEIKIVKKLLGSKRVMKEIVNMIKEKKKSYSISRCIVAHADNLEVANNLAQDIRELNLYSNVTVMPMKGLCTFYAMRKGIIVSFEK